MMSYLMFCFSLSPNFWLIVEAPDFQLCWNHLTYILCILLIVISTMWIIKTVFSTTLWNELLLIMKLPFTALDYNSVKYLGDCKSVIWNQHRYWTVQLITDLIFTHLFLLFFSSVPLFFGFFLASESSICFCKRIIILLRNWNDKRETSNTLLHYCIVCVCVCFFSGF